MSEYLSLAEYFLPRVREHLKLAKDQALIIKEGGLPRRKNFVTTVDLHRAGDLNLGKRDVEAKVKVGFIVNPNTPNANPSFTARVLVFGFKPVQMSLRLAGDSHLATQYSSNPKLLAAFIEKAHCTLKSELWAQLLLERIRSGVALNQVYSVDDQKHFLSLDSMPQVITDLILSEIVKLTTDRKFLKPAPKQPEEIRQLTDFMKKKYVSLFMGHIHNLYLIASGNWGMTRRKFAALCRQNKVVFSLDTLKTKSLLRLTVCGVKYKFDITRHCEVTPH